MSSDLHRAPLSSTTFTSVDEINTDLGPNSLYARTKLAQILFTRALVRRMQNNEPGFQSPKWSGPWVNAVHPGGVSTDQQEQAVDAYGTKGKIGVKAVRPFLKDPVDEGCRSGLFAATSEDVVTEKIQGQYVSVSTAEYHWLSFLLLVCVELMFSLDRSYLIARSRSLRNKLGTTSWVKICGD